MIEICLERIFTFLKPILDNLITNPNPCVTTACYCTAIYAIESLKIPTSISLLAKQAVSSPAILKHIYFLI